MPRDIVWQPNAGAQTAFLSSTCREVLYGGAAGGGKTDALLVLDLRWAHHPKHRSLYLRRTRPQLQEAIDRSHQLYPLVVPGAQWRESESRWRMPSGAIFQFGYAEHEDDILNYKSFEYNVVKFDELTSFTEKQYLFMFLRNRTKAHDLPPLIRAGTNPGDVGHEFVFQRFIDQREPFTVYDEKFDFDGASLTVSRQFIPSHVWDNPALPNREAYIAGILQLGEDEVAAYLYGQWTRLQGAMFRDPIVTSSERTLADPHEYQIIRAIDFGTYDPSCVMWVAHYPRLGLIEVVDELYMRETTIDGLAAAIAGHESALGLKQPAISVGSPEMGNEEATSKQSIAGMLTLRGCAVTRANTDRLAGWARISNLLATGKLREWPGAAPELRRTLGRLQRDPKKPNDVRAKQDDHPADALRYAVMAVYDKPMTYKQPVIEDDDPNRDHAFDKLVKDIRGHAKGTEYAQLGVWAA